MCAMPKAVNATVVREKSLEEQLEYHKKLNSIANKIHSASDTNDILLNLQSEILGLFKAYRITVYVVDGIKREIVSRFKSGDEVNEIRVPINPASISGYCAASGKLVNIGDVYNDEELRQISPKLKFDKSWDEKTGFKTTQVLAAPISYNRYLLGVIQLMNKRGGKRFTKEDEVSVLDIAKVLGTAFFKNQKAAQKAKPTRFDYLIMNNIISNKDLASAMPRARKAKVSVESILMSDFNVSKADIGKSLANFYNTRFIPFNEEMMIPGELLKGLKVGFLRTNVFVPVAQMDGKVVVAMENPNYLPARDAIKRIIKAKDFEYCVSLKDDIYQMIDLFFDIKRGELVPESGTIEDILDQLETGVDDFEDEIEGVNEEDSAIVQRVNKMIVDAYSRGASDIHIEPRQGKAHALIRIRIDGACQLYQTLPFTYKRAIVSRLKIMSDLDIAERRLPQDGKIKFKKYAPLDIRRPDR